MCNHLKNKTQSRLHTAEERMSELYHMHEEIIQNATERQRDIKYENGV